MTRLQLKDLIWDSIMMTKEVDFTNCNNPQAVKDFLVTVSFAKKNIEESDLPKHDGKVAFCEMVNSVVDLLWFAYEKQ